MINKLRKDTKQFTTPQASLFQKTKSQQTSALNLYTPIVCWVHRGNKNQQRKNKHHRKEKNVYHIFLKGILQQQNACVNIHTHSVNIIRHRRSPLIQLSTSTDCVTTNVNTWPAIFGYCETSAFFTHPTQRADGYSCTCRRKNHADHWRHRAKEKNPHPITTGYKKAGFYNHDLFKRSLTPVCMPDRSPPSITATNL